jgi:ubiquinone/menaquinone biosynthesis C-methylase UbiE
MYRPSMCQGPMNMNNLHGISYKKRIMNLYNEPSYVKIYDRRYRTIQDRKYEAILPYLQSNNQKYLLDIGSGPGLFLKKVCNNWNFLVGVDISINMLQIAKNKLKPCKNTALILADSDHLPFKANVFPIVTSFTLNMPNPLKTLKEIVRVGDGMVAITTLRKKLNELSLQNVLQKLGVNFEIIESESEDIFVVFYTT